MDPTYILNLGPHRSLEPPPFHPNRHQSHLATNLSGCQRMLSDHPSPHLLISSLHRPAPPPLSPPPQYLATNLSGCQRMISARSRALTSDGPSAPHSST